jgi:hypothetical protein
MLSIATMFTAAKVNAFRDEPCGTASAVENKPWTAGRAAR